MDKIRSLQDVLRILLRDTFKVSLETDKKTRKKMVVIRELEEGRSLKDVQTVLYRNYSWKGSVEWCKKIIFFAPLNVCGLDKLRFYEDDSFYSKKMIL